jgi:hypothetical protein
MEKRVIADGGGVIAEGGGVIAEGGREWKGGINGEI